MSDDRGERGRGQRGRAGVIAVLCAALLGGIAGSATTWVLTASPYARRDSDRRAESSVTAPPVAIAEPPAIPSFMALGNGYVLQGLRGGRLALLRWSGAAAIAASTSLTIEAVYEMREDPKRYLLAPDRWAAHGHYLDDVGADHRAALEAHRTAFLGEVRVERSEASVGPLLESHGRAMLRLGDATFLIDALRDRDHYAARRAAAFVLGEDGFRVASPILAEVLEEQGPGRERAAQILRALHGREFASREAFEAHWATVPAKERFTIVRTPAEGASR